MKILAVVLFTLLTGTVYAQKNGETHDEKIMHSIYDISIIEKQLEAYKKEHGQYPKTDEGLKNIKKYSVTVTPDHIVPDRYLEGNVDNRKFKWEGYRFPEPDLVDGWGRKYEYKSNGVKYSIHSYGDKDAPDGAKAEIVIFSSK